MRAEGVVVDITVQNSEGKVVYQNISEEFDLKTKLELIKDEYTVNLSFMTDAEQLHYYLNDKGYVFDEQTMDELRQPFYDGDRDEFLLNAFILLK